MKIKQKLLIIITIVFLSIFSNQFMFSSESYAGSCGGVDTSIINCDEAGNSATCLDNTPITYDQYLNGTKCKDGKDPTINKVNIENNALWGLLLDIIDIFTTIIGVAAVGGIVFGAVKYSSAGGNADQVKKAKETIINVVIGLLAYALLYSFLNYLIPGGIFN
jgi:hypothetical protein